MQQVCSYHLSSEGGEIMATITQEEALNLARAELLNITTAAWDDITYEDFYKWARNRAQFALSATAPDKVAAHDIRCEHGRFPIEYCRHCEIEALMRKEINNVC
jgi:hypothetical protein